MRASLLGPRGWDNSERSSAQGAGLAHWLQVGAVQVEPVGSLAGRLLEGSPGHLWEKTAKRTGKTDSSPFV